jgi:hypothetical protein
LRIPDINIIIKINKYRCWIMEKIRFHSDHPGAVISKEIFSNQMIFIIWNIDFVILIDEKIFWSNIWKRCYGCSRVVPICFWTNFWMKNWRWWFWF